jgi:UDP-N-acetylglucosamine 2-epimerase (non-hydrolysing)
MCLHTDSRTRCLVPEILVVVGTRPELIKLAATIHALRELSTLRTTVIFTGQHPDLVGESAKVLDVVPDEVIRPLPVGRTLTDLLAHTIRELGITLARRAAACLVVQGDTVSALGGAITSELLGIPLVHVEAGVRSRLRDDPFPEETIRRIVSSISEAHVCFSDYTKENLLGEGVDPGSIVVTPHPLRDRVSRVATAKGENIQLDGRFAVLATLHRRERRPARAATLIAVLRLIRREYPDLKIGFVWHPGLKEDLPDLRDDLCQIGVDVVAPMASDAFIETLASARFVITDSGGAAEEAQMLGRPLLVLRSISEVRLDEAPVTAMCATESLQVASEFTALTLREPLPAIPAERSVSAPAGLVIASYVASFATSLAAKEPIKQ